jgi:hypothetical protein
MERDGVEGLHPRRTHGRRGRPVQVAPEAERLVQSVAISAGTWDAAGSLAIWPGRWKPEVRPYTFNKRFIVSERINSA